MVSVASLRRHLARASAYGRTARGLARFGDCLEARVALMKAGSEVKKAREAAQRLHHLQPTVALASEALARVQKRLNRVCKRRR